MTPSGRIRWHDQTPPSRPDSSDPQGNHSRAIEFKDTETPGFNPTSVDPEYMGNNQPPPAININQLSGLETHLNRKIIGQPLAVNRITTSLQSAFSGLSRPLQPRHVFAFLGSSGVGKTALAKAVADFLYDSPDGLIRLDMSEYKENRSIARLVGSPPGYAGYNDEGTFAARMRRRPNCIVLMDEFEKCHPEVLDVFLQIFDEGRFSDSHGRTIDSSRAVFILTSNLFMGSDQNSPEMYDQQVEAIRQNLGGIIRPEFVNRINSIILFRNLSIEDLMGIGQLEINALNQRLESHHIIIRTDIDALRLIAVQSYDPVSGARAVLRTVARSAAEPISTALIQGKVTSGQIIDLMVEAGRLRLNI